MKKNLLQCPNCEYNGKKQMLGEIDSEGNLVVLRFHKGSTIIVGSQFDVKCGECGEIVYKKGGANENLSLPFTGFYGKIETWQSRGSVNVVGSL